MSPRITSRVVIPFALGAAFAALFTVQSLLRGIVLNGHPDGATAIREAVTRWLLYAALAPAVAAVADRWPAEPGRLAVRVPLHVAAAVTFALVHTLGMALVYLGNHWTPPQADLRDAWTRLTLSYFGVDVVVYAATSGAYHALRWHEETRRRDRLTAELRGRLTEARLDALRAQLEPHFLFNTLNAVSVLALAGERDRVMRALGTLSELLRSALDRELPQEVPLARELELLAPYLEIQALRMGERLTVTLDVAAAARDVLVPSMVLQPLVENALQHGVESRPGPGHVAVRAALRGDAVVLRVEDSGPGFRSGSCSAAAPPRTRAGVGLANTAARLEQLYGHAGTIERGDRDGGGGFVQLTLPARRAAAVA